uniref:Putative lipocalin-5 1 n=1 Tax=Rhipicephalus microplus TaxID=6941 RepID=A0A6M2CY27_RHIMP
MHMHAFTLALSVVWIAKTGLAKLGAPGGPQKLTYQEPDAFQVITQYEEAVAISDSDNDTIFDCLASHRMAVNYEARTATYAWNFKEVNGPPRPEMLLKMTQGPTPGTIHMIVGNDPSVRECKLYYADENCVVADMEYNGHQCILWIRRRLKDTVPQVCKEEFVDTCGVVIAPHRRDLCDDGEGDY